MAGRKRAAPENAVLPNAMIASAVRMQGTGAGAARAVKLDQGWHRDAWYFLDTIGEFRFSVNWVGNMLSRARLYAAKRHDNKWVAEPADSVAQRAVEQLSIGSGGQAQLLQSIGINLTVPGECYLLGYEEGGEDHWTVASTEEARWSGQRWKINNSPLPDSTAAIRIWRPHPKDRRYSDSATRAVLPILSEIDSLTKHVAAQVDSRLAGAGVYWVPSEMTFPSGEGDTSAQAFVKILTEAMVTAKKNREDASALVPIIITAPGEYLDKVKHDTFWTPLDEHAIELRSEAIRRLALGLDMPPEILTGTGETNHWVAWQIDEAAIKVHTTPPLELITSSLTAGYMWPHLEGEGFSDWRDYAILADTSQMRARPNRSREAVELYDRGKINSDALLREVGFEPSDAMEEDEFRQWLLTRVAGGSATPEQVSAALKELGIDLGDRTRDELRITRADDEEESRQTRPTPTLERHPRRDPPELPAASDAALLGVSEILVFRALERAGNRIKNRVRGKVDCAAVDLYLQAPPHASNIDRLLEDAWSMVPRAAETQGVDPVAMEAALDGYARYLLTEGRPHDRSLLRRHLASLTRLAIEERSPA